MIESSPLIRSFCVNYCDDIRQELGNKISLIGVYGSDLILAELPAAIPKLCIFAQAYSDWGQYFDEPVEFKVTLDDELITTTVSKPNVPSGQWSSAQFHRLVSQVIISPLVLEKEAVLRIRAFYKGEEYKAAGLRIRPAETDGGAPATATQDP